MRVACLLTVFNCGKYLQQAIDSVTNQTYTDWELLILDDNSTDPLVHEVVAGVNTTDPRIRYHRFDTTPEQRRMSVRYAENINWGARATTGQLISYLAGDDYWMPTRLERMVAKAGLGNHVVYGPQLLLNEYDQKLGLRESCGHIVDAFHRVDLNSVLHTREAFEKAGGWPTDPGLWKDADGHFWRRLHAAGYRFVPVDGSKDPTDAKRYRENSVTMNILAGRDPWHDSQTRPVLDPPEWLVK